MDNHLTGQQREVIIQDLDELRRIVREGKRYFSRKPWAIDTATVSNTEPGSEFWLVNTRARELGIGPVTESLVVVVTVATLIIEQYEEALRQDELAQIRDRINRKEK